MFLSAFSKLKVRRNAVPPMKIGIWKGVTNARWMRPRLKFSRVRDISNALSFLLITGTQNARYVWLMGLLIQPAIKPCVKLRLKSNLKVCD